MLAVISLSAFGCRVDPKKEAEKLDSESIEWWGVWHDSSEVAPLIAAYQKIYPHVSIQYRNLRYEEYEQKNLEALAEDRGPDIFTIPSTWVKKYKKRILPIPENTTVSFRPRNEKGELGRVTSQTTPSLTVRELRSLYIPTVKKDVILENQIWGLPLEINVMALYYNKQILDDYEIYDPAKDWTTFTEHVKKLTVQGMGGELVQSAVPMGTALNIPQSADILALLMMQTGVEMLDASGARAVFNEEMHNTSGSYNPGLAALKFYTDFANPAKAIYTWNESQPIAISAFEQQKAVYFLGYNYHLPILQRDALGVDFAIAKIPQPAGSTADINLTNYWIETVSSKSKNSDRAWHFLQFITKEEIAPLYINNKPSAIPALKSLLLKAAPDPKMQIFYEDAMNANTWYAGNDYDTAEQALKEMITSVARGENTPKEALDFGAQKVSQTLY